MLRQFPKCLIQAAGCFADLDDGKGRRLKNPTVFEQDGSTRKDTRDLGPLLLWLGLALMLFDVAVRRLRWPAA